MKISNVSEFFQFVRSNGLINICPEVTGLVVCMETYGRLCPCDPPDSFRNKLGECKRFYMAFVMKSKGFQNQLLAKVADNRIEFCNDGQHIITITR